MLTYRTDPLTDEESGCLDSLLVFDQMTGIMHPGLVASFCLTRAVNPTRDDIRTLLHMSQDALADELVRCLQNAPCFCNDPNCPRRSENIQQRVNASLDPMDRPANPGESQYTEQLSKIGWPD